MKTLCFSHACKRLGIKRDFARTMAKHIGYQETVDSLVSSRS